MSFHTDDDLRDSAYRSGYLFASLERTREYIRSAIVWTKPRLRGEVSEENAARALSHLQEAERYIGETLARIEALDEADDDERSVRSVA